VPRQREAPRSADGIVRSAPRQVSAAASHEQAVQVAATQIHVPRTVGARGTVAGPCLGAAAGAPPPSRTPHPRRPSSRHDGEALRRELPAWLRVSERRNRRDRRLSKGGA
jgi:hypothetical protein